MKLNEMSGTGGGVGGGSFTPGTGMGVATKPAFRKKKKKKRNPYKLTNMMNEVEIKPTLNILKDKILQRTAKFHQPSDNPLFQKSEDLFWKPFEDAIKMAKSREELENILRKHFSAITMGTAQDREDVIQNYLNEAITYSKFKNEVKTRTKQQQLHRSVKEVQKRLNEINKVLEYTNRMRNEITESGDNIKYSRFTEQALKQIKEMTVDLYKNIKELKK